jgi:uncharacterized repeat protein (TIGR03806 family)
MHVVTRSSCASIFAFLALAVAAQGASPLPNFKPWKGSKLEGTRGKPMPYRVEKVFPDIPWKEALSMTPVPGSPGHYLVVERSCKMWIVSPDGKRTPFMQIRGRGMNALFHPKFPKEPYVYIRYSSDETNRVRQFTVANNNGYTGDPKSGKAIVEWHSRGHRGGDLGFGPDGFLYISTGDGQLWGDPHNTAQNTETLQASILRIDVLNPPKGKPYGIPKDNPFVGMKGVRPEIWAYGMRNPWRFTFRPGTNELWVGDNGDENWEMVSRIGRGTNHGWSVFEGTHLFRAGNKLKGPTKKHTPPIVEHSHREMRSVIGGRWYRGQKFPELRDYYVYGCHVTGKLWAFTMKGDTPTKPAQIANVGGQIVSFAEDRSGELLVVTLDKGIFRMIKTAQTAHRPVPKLLSATGLFASTKSHTPSSGLVPYDINLPMYRDGATSHRYIAIPQNQTIRVRHSHRRASLLPPLRSRLGLDRWRLPVGGLLMQTLFVEDEKGMARRVETQISMNDDQEWRFLSYRWNKDQTDAELVPASGAETHLATKTDPKLRWRFSSRSECAACHTHPSEFAPGVHLAQLNRTFDYSAMGGKKTNQIAMFRDLGLLTKGFGIPKKELVMPKIDDKSASVEDRARAYLHVNCAHCHRETGIAGRATFQLLAWMKNEGLNLIDKKPLVGIPGGDPKKARLIAPGEPEHSEIYRRMASPVIGKMPLFGTTTVDKQGVELIRQWIQSLPATQ